MSKSFEIEGKIKVINDIQTFDSGFTKREFVIEVEDGKFPQMIKFECVRDKTSLTDGLETDDPVRVTFDIRGNEYKGRYYVNLNAWKLEKGGGGGGGGDAPAAAASGYGDEEGPPSHLSEPPGDTVDVDDDIPF
ncbi:MAG: DUF3127 domain-containing protein [Akkermansiaceae bacterium]|nr:DUF3127 domain-containing protein [Akkermansiaceae bacterium]NNM30523.1 DUF3127 domain-containing protein [Akkermansiaceae bacterium]